VTTHELRATAWRAVASGLVVVQRPWGDPVPRLRRLACAASALLCLAASPASADEPAAAFTQLVGADGCISSPAVPWSTSGPTEENPDVPPLGECRRARALGGARELAVSPDQRHVLVVTGGGAGSSAIVTLQRDPQSGALTFLNCMSDSGGDGRLGSEGACADADGLDGPEAVALSPDGRWLFVAARRASSVTWFSRDPATGAVEQRGCLRGYAAPRQRCSAQGMLEGASAIVAANGLVFVAARDAGAVHLLRHDAATGDLRAVSCVSDSGSDGACENGRGLRGASDLQVSPDGRTLYAVAQTDEAVTTFAVDPDAGTLKQTGCFADEVTPDGTCEPVSSLAGADTIALSPDGRDLYVGAREDGALTIMRRSSAGSLTRTACLVNALPRGEDSIGPTDVTPEQEAARRRAAGTADCTPVRALAPADIAISADGRSLFVGGGDALSALRRVPDTGRLTWAACAEQQRTYRACTPSRAPAGGNAVAATADGRNLYFADEQGASVSVFAASLATAASARVGRDGVARLAVRCPSTRVTGCRGRVIHPWLQRPAAFAVPRGAGATLALHLRGAAIRAVAGRRVRALTLTVTDQHRLTRADARRVSLRR
jgi:6-phosphogluconolactonase (cycloisomerase 2 family)